jgi:hypothetical protein
MEESVQLHVPAAVHPGKELWRREKYLASIGNRTPIP